MFFVGRGGNFTIFQGLDWLTALLGSVSTVTTIGLILRISSRWPTRKKILLIIIIVASVGSAASFTANPDFGVTKKEFFMSRLEWSAGQYDNNHIIVMGYSFLGKYVGKN